MALMQMEFKSETLKRTVSANVILPIERFRGPFPTLYLLHGLTDNYNGWLSYSRIRLWAEESGLQDHLLEANRSIAKALSEAGADVTYEDGEGIHDWYFWDAYIQHVLKWLDYQTEQKA